MTQIRKITDVITPKLVMEGAGVMLYRSISPSPQNPFDPFLLFDHFAFNDPTEGVNPGFPTHPHRGIETVTYILEGTVRHRDSLGNKGVIGPGEVQWMSAGSGILHEEMPFTDQNGNIHGFQLWVNLPAAQKMSRPAYQEVSAEKLPTRDFDGYTAKIIAGELNGFSGPVSDINITPNYMDIELTAGKTFTYDAPETHTVGVYLLSGTVTIAGRLIDQPALLKLEDGDVVEITNTGDGPARFIFICGKRINEPIVPYGPFVMNTVQEIQQTIMDLRTGNFIKNHPNN